MFLELNKLHAKVDQDVQIMETAVGSKTAPTDVTDNICSISLIDSFDQLYYGFIGTAHLHEILLVKQQEISHTLCNQTVQSSNSSIYQLPKRKFPNFSGSLKQWLGYEDLFTSIHILLHHPQTEMLYRFSPIYCSALIVISYFILKFYYITYIDHE